MIKETELTWLLDIPNGLIFGAVVWASLLLACDRQLKPSTEPKPPQVDSAAAVPPPATPMALDVKQLATSPKGVLEMPFAEVLASVSDRKMIAVPRDQGDQPAGLQVLLAAITVAADGAVQAMNDDGSPARELRRINEVSRLFEDALAERINTVPGLVAEVPTTEDGRRQTAGYPDLRVEHSESQTVAYLDPKLYERGSEQSSLRSFYYTPRLTTNKVRDDAYHLLLGISHDGVDGAWTFLGWQLVDLQALTVRLKPEFQASNRDLYQEDAVVGSNEGVEERDGRD